MTSVRDQRDNKESSTCRLQISSGDLAVKVSRSRRSTFQLTVDPSGEVTFRVPLAASDRRVQELLLTRIAWIEKTREKILRKVPRVKFSGFRNAAIFYVFGRARILRVVHESVRVIHLKEQPAGWLAVVPDKLEPEEQERMVRTALVAWFRREAREYLATRIDLWSRKMGIAPPRLLIKQQKRLWGSCNKCRRTVNLNWKILSFPSEVIDYVIIHELCHLFVADHSQRFWREVARWCPEWKKLRGWLKLEAFRQVMPG